MTPSNSPEGQQRGFAIGCAVAVPVALALAVGSVLWVRQSLVNWANPPAPDVSAVARSAPVDAADRTATRKLDTELARVERLLSWARPVARGVEDRCDSQEDDPDFGSRPTWSPVTCQRTVVWFARIGGPLSAVLTRLDSSLQHADVKPDGTPINQLYEIGHARAPELNSANDSYGDGNVPVDITVDAPPNLQEAIGEDRDLLISASPPPAPGATVDRAYTPVWESELTAQVKPSDYVIGLRVSLAYRQ
ncbi:hypothetical protein [Streptacidiphilus melanogenes]|uniref:hypothetical protein n=1 Tax=Streptacidiphilus melanogenes TaxID=411235 RepID=UPI0005AB76C3|nr:hypothetical protein [Streptacidiphilus melanogenes]